MADFTMDRLFQIMSDVFMLPDFEFLPDMAASDVPNWDSLNHSILMMEISSEVGVDIPAADAAERKSIGSLYEFIWASVGAAKSG